MRQPGTPGLEKRRSSDFERELSERARLWLPFWSLDEAEPDFGMALLKIAARFSSEVAERLDRAGDKMALGFLDWLALRPEAARPARMPVAFKLAETAPGPVTALRPVKMQVDAGEATVTFETETSIELVPGTLDLVVGVDPAADAYYLPPPGLTGLDPLEPLPSEWRIKSFAAAGSATLQLDPGLGLSEGMLIAIAGKQYEIKTAKDDLVAIEPEVPEGDGFAAETLVKKVGAFHPFDVARNRQEHILYIGDSGLLDIEDAAMIEVRGLSAIDDGVDWQYWGKAEGEGGDEPDWRPIEQAIQTADGAVRLAKPKGAVEESEVAGASARWIRAHRVHSGGMITTDGVRLRINPPAPGKTLPAALDPVRWDKLLRPEVFVNATPSSTANFYLLGREPRLFDTLYVGSSEAFSKPGATAWIQFDLSDGLFANMAVFDASPVGSVLASVDKAGTLHLFGIGANGELSRLGGREPLQPPAAADAGAAGQASRLTSSTFRPPTWVEDACLCIAVAAHDRVWVRKESPSPEKSKWEFRGTVPTDGDPAIPIEGLVVVKDGAPTLMALRNGRLYKPSSSGSAAEWPTWPIGLANNQRIVRIAGVRAESASTTPKNLLITVLDQSNSTYALHRGDATGASVSILSNAAGDVVPFGIERTSGALEVVAVEEGPRKLWAKSVSASVTGNIAPHQVANTIIDGHIEGNQLIAFCLAADTSNQAVVLSWLPFEPSLAGTVFAESTGTGDVHGSISVSQKDAFLPGKGRGEIFAAALGRRQRFTAQLGHIKSALAYPQPSPPLQAGDFVVVNVGGTLMLAKIDAVAATALRGFSASSFFWLDRGFNRDTAADTILTYAALPTSSGTVVSTTSLESELTLDSSLPLPLVNSRLLVGTGVPGADPEVVEIISFNGFDAKVQPPLTAPVSTTVDYWTQNSTIGRIFPALKLDATNNDWDINLSRSGALYFPAHLPSRQPVIAVAEHAAMSGKPEWVALEFDWTLAPSGNTEFVVDAVASAWRTARSDHSSNPALAWEYWNGAGWWRLKIDEDQTSNFRDSGFVRFAVPDDLTATDWAGITNHWVRARLIGGDYGKEKVVVISEPVPGNPTQQQQTVKRTTEGIQPPYALNVGVTYALDNEAVPRFLKTKDSGTLRDQSDANRTPGANIEIFTPLAVTLARLDAPAGSADPAAEQCVPDCECPEGTASLSPRPTAAAVPAAAGELSKDAASQSGGRALYLGFNSKLLGGPVNLLLAAAQERNHDLFAPLWVDALIGDRFRPIVAADETRALGETGLLKMNFAVEPIKRELFGRTLAWLRLAPRSGGEDWKPAIGGAYLNAVWARSAETMTRELVGSSSGQPRLTLALARPPVLRDSLELRVRELLGEEELDRLRKEYPDRVKSGVEDLPGDWVLWRQVDDPLDCAAGDRVYALDEASGAIRFGDGRHGAIPPAGADSIVAFKYERTEAGSRGGVPANSVKVRDELNLVSPVESVEAVLAAGQSAGGVAVEPAERVRKFAPARIRHRGRALAATDFEDLARQRSAEVVQARAFVRAGRVRLVVVMRGRDPQPSQAQRRELRRMLLEASPPAMAARDMLTIEGPRVRRLRVELWLQVETIDVAAAVAEQAKAQLTAFFDTERGGALSGGWPLGANPAGQDIAEALLDIEDLRSIVRIRLVEADGPVERPWPATLGPRDLAMLAAEPVRFEFAIAGAAA